MHFAIPDVQDFVSRSSTFTGFNVHINGSFHACLRYKQLHSLHEQLRRALPNLELPPFPSKKIFLLTPTQLEQRRASLERYIQLIGQDPTFSKTELLRSFLLAAQQESAAIESTEIPFDVYLMNGHRISLTCLATDCSSKVLEKACESLELPSELTYYFALFLMRKDDRGDVVIQRKLMDFEAPYITQRTIGDVYKCVLRKCYWDSCYDVELMRDKVALNLLYIQTVSDCERGWTLADSRTKEQLAALQAGGKKKEYLDIARNLENYGSLHFTGCVVDYPERDLAATVTIGNKEINFQTQSNNSVQETKFRVTRIRCWKITTIQNPATPLVPTLELSFEFLMSKNYLKWIVIRSEKAMMMTVCLQSLVNELLNQKSDTNNLKKNATKASGTQISYLKRDDTNQFRPAKDSSGPERPRPQVISAESPISSSNEEDRRGPSRTTVKQKLREISTTVFFKAGQNRVHNEAFEGIGDEDL